MYDLLIRGANLYDGSGRPPELADVAVQGERIAAIEQAAAARMGAEEAGQVIEGEGLCLAPGFIDVHSHSDVALLACPTADSKIYQGITTDVYGQCGSSVFPVTEKNRGEYETELKSLKLELDWKDLAGYRARIEAMGFSVNAMAPVGHSSLRAAVMGYDQRPPTPDELRAMISYLEQAMDEGAIGLSSGLQYPPGRFAETDEVIALAEAAGRRKGLYATHMRCEGDDLMDSVEETIRIGREGRLPVIVSHLKASGRPNWGKAGQAMTLIEIARRQGQEIVFDRYPYLASATGLDIFMPAWAQAGGREKLTERLRSGDKKLFEEYRLVVETQTGWERILITDTPAPGGEALIGKSVADIARERGEEPWRVAIDLLIEAGCQVSMCNFSMCQEDTDRVLAHPCCMIGTDAAIASAQGPLGRRKPHPRAYGTFPRFLSEYVRERQLVPVEEAIRRMTSLPAETLGLKQRGRVQKGYWADLVLFRFEALEDRSRFGDPHHFPAGIEFVIVNGRPVIENGRHTGARPGRFLTREV